jgi:heme oxygenase
LKKRDTYHKNEVEDQRQHDFLDAQSKFQANMQMFNNIANLTATTIKTLGEACTSLSRKQ